MKSYSSVVRHFVFGIIAAFFFAAAMSASSAPAAAKDFSTAVMAEMANSAYHVIKKKERAKYTPKGFKLLKYYRDSAGVDASVFEHTATGSIALAFAGTQPSDPRDVLADLGIVGKEINAAFSYLINDMINNAKWIPKAAKTGVKKTMHAMYGVKQNAKILKCPKGSFFDVSTGACWSCPNGTHRTVFSIKGGKACERRPQTHYVKASKKRKVKIGKKGCKKGEFWDKKGGTWGACWTCPKGYKRGIAKVDGSKACLKVSGFRHYKATRLKLSSEEEKARNLLNKGPRPSKKLNRQVNAALAIVDKVTGLKKSNGQKIKLGEIQVTGHSLGGFLVQVVTVRKKVKRGVAFNPPGAQAYLRVGRKRGNLTNHVREHDIVGRFGQHVGKIYVYHDVKFQWKKIKKRWLMRNHGSEELKTDLAKGMRPKKVL